MKTNQLKLFLTTIVVVGSLLSTSCSQPQEGVLNFKPVDLSEHKLPSDKAKKMSNRYIRDMKILFAQSRSEEHTSELQSRENLVCRLLLEKKNKKHKQK